MIYRCVVCQNEETRGVLPTATHGLYGMFLLALSAGCVAGAARGMLGIAEQRPSSAVPVDGPWWINVVAVAVGLALIVAGMVVINYLLGLIEWLAFVRRRCPACGSRRWTRGFTRGFGL